MSIALREKSNGIVSGADGGEGDAACVQAERSAIAKVANSRFTLVSSTQLE
jgi:hypothetical protein